MKGKKKKVAFNQILSVSAPSQANPGDSVTLTVSIKALSGNIASLTGDLNGQSLYFSPDWIDLSVGEIGTFSVTFTMPAQEAIVRIWVWYWDAVNWQFDVQTQVSIAIPYGAAWILVDKTGLTALHQAAGVGIWVLVDKMSATAQHSGQVLIGIWVLVEKSALTAKHPTPLPPPPEGEGGFPWKPVLIGVGGVIVLAAVATGTEKGKSITKSVGTKAKSIGTKAKAAIRG